MFLVTFLIFFLYHHHFSPFHIQIKFFSPAGASLQLVPNSKFRIHNSLCRPHSHPSHYSHCSHNCPCGSHPIIPIAPTIAPHKQHNCSIFPLLKGGQGGMLLYFHPRPTIQNSEFKIHNLPIPSLYLERFIGLKNAYIYGR